MTAPAPADERDSPRGFWRRAPFWAGLTIFIAAAALRLSMVSTARFTGDESNTYATAMEIVDGKNFPLLGPVLTGGTARHPGPLFYWLAALPHLLSRAPEAENVFFELMGAATVLCFWLSLRRPFGEAGAAFAGFMMALSPWSALFGDRAWNPHAFLFFEGLALLAVIRLRENPHSAWAAVVPPACLALPHFHMSAPVFWLALLVLGGRSILRWNRRYLAMGIALGLLLYIPVAIYEARTGFGNTRFFIAETFHGKARPPSTGADLEALLAPVYTLRFLTLDVTYHELSGYWGGLNEAAAAHALFHGSPARPFHPLRVFALLASGALLLLAVACAVWGAVERGRRLGWKAALGPFAASALAAIVFSTLLLQVSHKKVFAHYVVLTLPFVFVIFAALGQVAWRHRALRSMAIVLAVIVCAGGVEATESISRRVDCRNGLVVHRAVINQFLQDCCADGKDPTKPPNAIALDIAFMGSPYQYATFARYALKLPLRWQRGGYHYRLQKREDPPPSAWIGQSVRNIGPVSSYRLP
jgi:hypothetical protein